MEASQVRLEALTIEEIQMVDVKKCMNCTPVFVSTIGVFFTVCTFFFFICILLAAFFAIWINPNLSSSVPLSMLHLTSPEGSVSNTSLSFRHMSRGGTRNREDRLRPLAGSEMFPLEITSFDCLHCVRLMVRFVGEREHLLFSPETVILFSFLLTIDIEFSPKSDWTSLLSTGAALLFLETLAFTELILNLMSIILS
ncbi:hypothetical protein TNIN_166981 [Trichonephila inaurata madagascariensis]|uniref:Transmembrane protein n=1 Tax=Trichonephila inaurata madagascariensis TaxID=2747483 RepID=A0A8X6XIU4_9ARAC|nr:hypothetical protein TNIN_166981 [Trichonephila inaurata madagascariensis]